MIAVIPTCRSISLEHFGPLIDDGVRFIVVDDSEGVVKVNHPQFEVYTWADRRRILGGNEIAIPRGTGSCRDLGFYIAWKESDVDEIVVALDDDCSIELPDFPEQVRSRFRVAKRPTLNGNPRFYNHFDLYEDGDLAGLFPRGFPYSARVNYQRLEPGNEVTVAARFNLGLWKGVPDIHAVDRIGLERCEFPEARLLHENVILPEGTATCLCAGSMQLHREVVPAIYQLPMMIEIFPGWPLDRLGDIWAGYILKTLMDIRGERMSVGGPLVRHLRIGPLQQNLRREHLGHLVNEEFIDLLTHLRGEIESGDYQEMMAQLQELFARNAHKASPILCAYLSKLQSPLSAWIAALRS